MKKNKFIKQHSNTWKGIRFTCHKKQFSINKVKYQNANKVSKRFKFFCFLFKAGWLIQNESILVYRFFLFNLFPFLNIFFLFGMIMLVRIEFIFFGNIDNFFNKDISSFWDIKNFLISQRCKYLRIFHMRYRANDFLIDPLFNKLSFQIPSKILNIVIVISIM